MKESLVDASPKKPRRPPNGYNLFLKRHGHKAKERDRVWELYSRARNSNKKANKLARIATTGEIASLWGVDSEMRERFEREAKEQQELYRAQNETWRAAERFQFSQTTCQSANPRIKHAWRPPRKPLPRPGTSPLFRLWYPPIILPALPQKVCIGPWRK